MAFLLVHSPIVGADTWEPVAAQLRRGGTPACVPRLSDSGHGPFWRQHVAAVLTTAQSEIAAGENVAVVGHSGAGQLLALVAAAMRDAGWHVDACLFVDAGLPTRGTSRLDQLRSQEPAFADELEAALDSGVGFPQWDDRVLAPLVPDSARRARLLQGVRRLPRAYWDEPIPAVAGWPLVPCGVLLLSDGYEPTARAALEAGWPVRRVPAGNHFLGLMDPQRVADELLDLRRTVVGEA